MNLRDIPSIDRLLNMVPDLPRALARSEAQALTAQVRASHTPPADWALALRERVLRASSPGLVRVINATGVVLHTNLGRAPLSAEAAEAAFNLGQGYCNLEISLLTGKRGERLEPIQGLMAELCGSESALAVNNNAAGVLLMLTALAAGREVVVSRGELVEIGGAFRVPEVVAAGGARLIEVGTTNRTRVRDYIQATTSNTAAWLLVHPSNFQMTGFVEKPDRKELVKAAKERKVLVLEDLGAGALVAGLGEPTVQEVMTTGMDVLAFSGDKLLGGPQAGLLVGKAAALEKLRRHPLYRALRLDRLVLSALEATLLGYKRGRVPPAVRYLQATPYELRARAERLKGLLQESIPQEWDVRLVAVEGRVGGGALPETPLPGFAVAIGGTPGAGRVLSDRLRQTNPAVIGRLLDGDLLLDVRAVGVEEEPALLASVRQALEQIRTPAPPGG